MNKIINSVIVASITVLATSAAWACAPMHKGAPCSQCATDMDANHDGFVTKKEFEAFHAKHFKELDVNHDGKLSQEEVGATASHHQHGHGDMLINKRFEAADANHDGALTREEAKDMPVLLNNFDEIDANKDGKVTPEEIQAVMGAHKSMPASTEKEPEKK